MKLENLKKIREERGLSQADLAKRLGWTPETIHRYEHGKRQPNIEKLMLIAKELNCTVTDLI